MRLKYEKVIHHAIVNNLFGFGYTKKSCNSQCSSKYYLFVTAPLWYINSTMKTYQQDYTTYQTYALLDFEKDIPADKNFFKKWAGSF